MTPEQIAVVLGTHRAVTYSDKAGLRCTHFECEGLVFQFLREFYTHQGEMVLNKINQAQERPKLYLVEGNAA